MMFLTVSEPPFVDVFFFFYRNTDTVSELRVLLGRFNCSLGYSMVASIDWISHGERRSVPSCSMKKRLQSICNLSWLTFSFNIYVSDLPEWRGVLKGQLFVGQGRAVKTAGDVLQWSEKWLDVVQGKKKEYRLSLNWWADIVIQVGNDVSCGTGLESFNSVLMLRGTAVEWRPGSLQRYLYVFTL